MVFYCRCFTSLFEEEEEGRTATRLASTSTYYTASSNLNSSSSGDSNPKNFTFSELKAATDNFSPSSKIREGEFVCVYKGVITNPRFSTQKIDVVVKQLRPTSSHLEHKEWIAQVNQLGVARHPNLVKLVGYCAQDDEGEIEQLLVYEYMPKRSVKDRLSRRSEAPTLSWTMRLKVAQDVARGLPYVHEHLQIILGDFKSSHVLIDDQWNVKLSGIGLEKTSQQRLTRDFRTAVIGATGYMAPEYIQTEFLTPKVDIWSYGVFLYELITGRLPLDTTRPKHEQKLLEWVKPYLDSERFELIIDPRLENKYSLEYARELSVIANKCLSIDPEREVQEMVNQLINEGPSQAPPFHALVLVAATEPKMSEVREMVNQLINEVPSQAPPLNALVSLAAIEPKMVSTHAKKTTENMKNEGETGSTDIQHKESACFSFICCRGRP